MEDSNNSTNSDIKRHNLAPPLKLRVSQISMSNSNSPENQRKLLRRLLDKQQESGGNVAAECSPKSGSSHGNS